MSALEIVVIIFCVLIVSAVVICSAVKKARNKKKGIPACCGDCSACCGCGKRMSAEEIKAAVKKIKQETVR